MARLLSQQEDFLNQPSLLEQVITQAGHECIFLPKFHCELNPIEMASDFLHAHTSLELKKFTQYWGWCKYRYRQIPKTSFAASKELALKYLDACPVEVIRRFINRSWRFMSAYRKGLTGKAAEWAVRPQKQHRATSSTALAAIEAVVDA
jgi:hypothetical protein